MSKKSKSSKHKRSVVTAFSTAPSGVHERLRQISGQLLQQDYEGAVANCEQLLNYLPQSSPVRVDVLGQLGTAYNMAQDFPKAYAVLTQAISLRPHDPLLWHNRGLASRFTSRFGQSFRDFERAAALTTDPVLKKEIDRELQFGAQVVKDSIKLRGPNFTLDQLIEQENTYTRGLNFMESHQWDEAMQMFRAAIAMGDCVAQPWFNIAGCYMRQGRYDEAEAALKRSLEIEPDYTLAKRSLAALPEIRRFGLPENTGTYDPFKGTVNQSLTFIMES